MSKRKLLVLFICLSLLYALVVLLGPVDPAVLARYHLTVSKTHQLNLTVVFPYLLIWASAFYGFSTFKKYARIIKDTPEGPGFENISRGLGFLAFSLPVNSLVASSFSATVAEHQSYLAPLSIIRNYLAIILPLLAFITISNGAEKLFGLIKSRKTKVHTSDLWTIITLLIASLFSWLMIARPADNRNPVNVYFLPNWLIVTTLTVPYLYTWYRGAMAAYYISRYQRNVKGQLYRDSLRFLSSGIFAVILLNIFIQLITTLSGRLYRLQLTPILLVVYLLIAMYAVGFGLIAAGAKRMKRIEEV